jgi:predicted ATPase
VLWAGRRQKATKSEPVRLRVEVRTDHFSYEMSCGLPAPSSSVFHLDPEMKEEYVWSGGARRAATTMFERSRGGTWIRDRDGKRVSYSGQLLRNESVLSQLREPHLYPELSQLQNELANWRFYHQFRTDLQSPLRQPQIGVFTPVLSHDGRDLAAALATIQEVGDREAMQLAVREALGGAELQTGAWEGRFSVQLQTPGMLRPLKAQEFSDGTMRYLCLVAALLSPRPPSLLALNEPETSLHPDLIEPLARLIVQASAQSQIWITTHSKALASFIEAQSGRAPLSLELVEGATQIAGQGLILDEPEEWD